ncbi:hypothetical protein HMPREF3159_13150 [Brachybacterium sp. HMSC06H03]|uniref:hypothetical protein n=1 Tax=Brachybacterium sp. HMSC06H03 TaxID=1581127 RepID=UPI0008A39D27|nr:hypothetical protein [Brachybacterium sp. HMSC06H03]OFT48865.1 hypothetical protein HMPREF3159_13150 [Brachybacterium sp. HMSC06H03]
MSTTTIYVPTPITSAEQAEALPSGTLARHSQGAGMDHAHKLPAYPRTTTGFWRSTDGLVSDGAMVGWTALVPIEAEEERARSQINITHLSPPAPQMVPVRLPCPRCGLR